MISQDYFIVFVSPKPDKRKKSYKFFQEHCEVKTFSPMDMRSLPKFLTQEFTAHNTTDQTLTRELIEHIVMLVGKDGWRLSSEIYKLCSSLNAQPQPLTKEFINTIMTPSQEANTFELVDELLRRPSASLLSQIDTFLQSGTQRQAIHGGFLRGIKNILAYGYCIQH